MAGLGPSAAAIACRGIAAAHEAGSIRRRRERKADHRPGERRLQGKAMHGEKREGEPQASQSGEQSPAHEGKRHPASPVVNAAHQRQIGPITAHPRESGDTPLIPAKAGNQGSVRYPRCVPEQRERRDLFEELALAGLGPHLRGDERIGWIDGAWTEPHHRELRAMEPERSLSVSLRPLGVQLKEKAMKTPIVLASIAAAICLASPAGATERGAVGGAIVGGAAGAAVGGPVGAVIGAGAGAVTGNAVTQRRYYYRHGYYAHYPHYYHHYHHWYHRWQ
jgi:hypothetical protein